MSVRLLWDVDTRVDFIRADGKLPVPDADHCFAVCDDIAGVIAASIDFLHDTLKR